LLVPADMRAFALAMMTLNLHAWGDVPSPPIIGAVAGAWGPSCMGTPQSHCTGADPDDFHQAYTHDQLGVLGVLLMAGVYMISAAAYWGMAYLLLACLARQSIKTVSPEHGNAHANSAGSTTSSDVSTASIVTRTSINGAAPPERRGR